MLIRQGLGKCFAGIWPHPKTSLQQFTSSVHRKPRVSTLIGGNFAIGIQNECLLGKHPRSLNQGSCLDEPDLFHANWHRRACVALQNVY